MGSKLQQQILTASMNGQGSWTCAPPDLAIQEINHRNVLQCQTTVGHKSQQMQSDRSMIVKLEAHFYNERQMGLQLFSIEEIQMTNREYDL